MGVSRYQSEFFWRGSPNIPAQNPGGIISYGQPDRNKTFLFTPSLTGGDCFKYISKNSFLDAIASPSTYPCHSVGQ